jgi:predicted RNA-binding protein with RPS1 domain
VLPDPWNLIRENYKKGQKIPVKISRLVQSGAFVRLPEGAEAFMPISEMSSRRIKKPQEAVEAGQDVEATIIDLRPEERRMVLSLRDGSEPQLRDAPSYEFGRNDRAAGGKGRKKGGRKGGRQESEAEPSSTRTPTGGATIGERLGMLKGILPGDGAAEAAAPAPEEAPEAPAAPEANEAEEVKAE